LYYKLHKIAKPNETDRWAAESELELKQFWMIAAGAEVQNVYNGGAEAEPEVSMDRIRIEYPAGYFRFFWIRIGFGY